MSTKNPRGRPRLKPGTKAERLTIMIPPDLLARLRARLDGTSVSREIRRLIEAELARD